MAKIGTGDWLSGVRQPDGSYSLSIGQDAAGNAQGSTANPTATVATPTNTAAAGIAPKVNRDVSSLVLQSGAANLYNAHMIAGATAGFFVAYNAGSVPTGMSTARILAAVPVAANGFANIDGIPYRFDVGIVLLFTTSLTTFTAPANPALFISGSYL